MKEKSKDGRYKDTKKSRNRVDKYKSIRKKKRKGFCGTSSHDIPKGSEDLAVFQGDNMPTSVDDEEVPTTTRRLSAMEKKFSQPLERTHTKNPDADEVQDTSLVNEDGISLSDGYKIIDNNHSRSYKLYFHMYKLSGNKLSNFEST